VGSVSRPWILVVHPLLDNEEVFGGCGAVAFDDLGDDGADVLHFLAAFFSNVIGEVGDGSVLVCVCLELLEPCGVVGEVLFGVRSLGWW